MVHIKSIFENLILRLGHSQTVASQKWGLIYDAYASESRFYHNLNHIETLLRELEKVKEKIEDWDSILFALVYHDIIYDSFRSDNEELSSELAAKELSSLNIPSDQIRKVCEIIIATKSHSLQIDNDINIFLDADISILGADKNSYDNYSKNVRIEFIQYPSFVYNQGRIKVLEYFLSRDKIYHTDYFYRNLEQKAIENINAELYQLKKIKHTFTRTDNNEFVQYIENDGDLCEFFYNSAKILDQTEEVKKINYYPGWFDSGYYRFNYKSTSLHLEFDGMLGIYLRTEPNPSEHDKLNAKEIFQKLIDVRLTNKDLERVRKFYNAKNTANSK